MSTTKLTKEQSHVISAVTFGNLLEWYDIYSYAYLSPILAKVFFSPEFPESNLLMIFLIFGSAFLIRPFGGIIFGRFGDLVGRKASFLWSVVIITIPTFAMGCLPTYSQMGIYAPWLLIILRLIQAIPSAGEVPGTMCFLYEFSNQYPGQENRRFMTSWSGVGNQIGAILAVTETVIMDSYLSHEFMVTWGWRISFWSGGIIGLLGIYLRKTLHETPIFESAKKHHRLDTETILEVISNHRRRIILGTAFGAVSASTFYLAATYIPAYLGSELGLTSSQNTIVTLSTLIASTIMLPLIGRLGDKWNNKYILAGSMLIIIALLYPLYYAVSTHNGLLLLLIGAIYVVATTCITGLLGYVFAHLFPVQIRYTGVGLSFNLADGIIGGFTPAIALALSHWTGNEMAFFWYILGTAIISLLALLRIKN